MTIKDMELNKIYNGDAYKLIKEIPNKSIYYGDDKFPLNKDKVKRYTKRLQDMGVSYELIIEEED